MTGENRAAEMLLRGVRPLEPYPGSNKKWKSECTTCGEVVFPRYATVVQRGLGGCNLCAKKMAAERRFRESEAEYIAKAEELNFLPLEDYPGAQQKWKVQCLGCFQVFDKKAQSLMLGRGCPKCVNEKKSKANTAASKSRADAIMLSRQIEPLGPYKGWTSQYPGKCLVCDAFVAPVPRSLDSGQGGCTACGIRKRAKTRRNAAHLPEEAAQIMLASGCQVDDVDSYPGATRPWPGRCLNCGLRTKAPLSNVLGGHGVCRPCAQSESDSAFDYFGSGVLYLLENEQLKHFKIGIMGEKTNRLGSHASQGWQVIQTWSFAYGYEANYVEQYCLEAISDLGVTSTLVGKDMPQGGHTETFQMGVISVNKIQQLIQSEIRKKRWPTPKAFSPDGAKTKSRRTCTAARESYECTSINYSNGYCKKHYPAFKKYGDPFHRVRQEFTNENCEVEEMGSICGRRATNRGMCSTHASRYYIHGDATVLKRPAPKARLGQCSKENCEKADVSLGLCGAHYHEKRREDKGERLGLPATKKYNSDICSVSKCENRRNSLGFCRKHYGHFKKYGDPLGNPRGPVTQKIGECSISDCERSDDYRGLCKQHYSREYKRKKKGKSSLL